MKQAILILIPLLAGCGRGDGGETAARQPVERVQMTDLTGLYEAGGEGAQRGRMCMSSSSSGGTAFGIVTETPGGGSCGGAGAAVREGDVLRLTMAGDEACEIEARIEGMKVIFPAALGPGCAYYCGPGATLAGAIFNKTGGTAEDAMRATDLAGDPLCG